MQIFQNQQNRTLPGYFDEVVAHRCKKRRLIGDPLHRSAGKSRRSNRQLRVVIQIGEQIEPRAECWGAVELEATRLEYPHVSLYGFAGE